MIQYNVTQGTLQLSTGEVFHGLYSGHGPGVNNSLFEEVPNVGPIPRGRYTIGPLRDGGHLGPNVMDLDPVAGTNTFGRSLFRMHGDFAGDQEHLASEGCIIAPLQVRLHVNDDQDRILEVV